MLLVCNKLGPDFWPLLYVLEWLRASHYNVIHFLFIFHVLTLSAITRLGKNNLQNS